MIGGEIEIDPAFAPPRRGAPILVSLGLPAGRTVFFGTAREAVVWWARHVKPPGDVLLPSYCCRSVAQPFRELGIPYRYYPVGRDLAVDLPEAARRADHAGAVQVIHYFGFPAAPGLFSLGVPVLEDAVQAVLSPGLQRGGEWAIGSLRKFFPAPDGAFLTARQAFARRPRLAPAAGRAYGRKLYGRMLKHDAVQRRDSTRWEEALELLRETEEALDAGPIRPQGMSPRSAQALRGAPVAEMALARRRNYLALHEALRPVFADARRGIRPLLGELPAGVIPYGLPIVAERRDELGVFLHDRGIHSVVHWQLPDDVARDEFPDSWWLHERELTLPVDHRYGAPEMKGIAAAIAGFR